MSSMGDARRIESFAWPNGYRSAAIFTFDVDGCAEQQLYEGNILGHNSAGDYGPKVAVPRILDLLDKHDLKAAFFVPAWVAQRFPERIKEIHDRGHEIGAHGYLHENFSKLSDSEEKEIHRKSSKIISDITGTPPKAFRSPGGPLLARTMRILMENGYDCDSSSGKSYFPSKVKLEGKQIVEIPASWITDDFPYFWGGYDNKPVPMFMPISRPVDALEYWIAEFDGIHKIGGLFVHINHPRVIGRFSRLRAFEKLIRHIKATPGVWITDLRGMVDLVLKKE
jgi:peptidoglycan/xylan/chitin deacetylase (PgdA/CDA1 family)